MFCISRSKQVHSVPNSMNSFVPNTLRRRKSTTEGKASYIIRFFNQYNMKVVDKDILWIPNIFPSKHALDEIVCLFNSAKSSWYSRDCTFYLRKHRLKLVTWTKMAPKKFFERCVWWQYFVHFTLQRIGLKGVAVQCNII